MRHTNIPPQARMYAPNHPAVRRRILDEIEADVIGHIDIDGQYVSHRQQAPRQEPVESNSRFLDALAALSSITIIVLFGWSLGMWIAS